MHVLIVDDELLARNRLRVLLSDCEDPSAPFLVSEAATAAQALDVLHRTKDHHPVDMIFLDVQMPGQDGLRFAQTLRSLPRPPAVVFISAHAMYAANAFEVEAVDYLTKPVRPGPPAAGRGQGAPPVYTGAEGTGHHVHGQRRRPADP